MPDVARGTAPLLRTDPEVDLPEVVADEKTQSSLQVLFVAMTTTLEKAFAIHHYCYVGLGRTRYTYKHTYIYIYIYIYI